jgi:hypothetical protein
LERQTTTDNALPQKFGLRQHIRAVETQALSRGRICSLKSSQVRRFNSPEAIRPSLTEINIVYTAKERAPSKALSFQLSNYALPPAGAEA